MPNSPSSQPAHSPADIKEQSQDQQVEYKLPSGIDLSGRKEATQEQVRRDLEAVSERIGNTMDKNSATKYLGTKFNNNQKLDRRNAADAVCMQTLINKLLPGGETIQVDGRYFRQSIKACKTIQAKLFDKYIAIQAKPASPNPQIYFTNGIHGNTSKTYTKEQFCDGIFGNDTFELYKALYSIQETRPNPFPAQADQSTTETETETTDEPQTSPNAFPNQPDQSTEEENTDEDKEQVSTIATGELEEETTTARQTREESTDKPQTPEQKRDAVTRTVFHLHESMELMEEQAVTSYSEEELEKRTNFISKIKTAIASYKATPAPVEESAKTKWLETGKKVEELEGSIVVIESNIEASNIYNDI